MKTEEANRIIAEYMGWNWDDHAVAMAGLAIPSLDALVPVWDAMGKPAPKFERRRGKKGWIAYYGYAFEQSGSADTIQEAACIATAKAIEELRDGDNNRKSSR